MKSDIEAPINRPLDEGEVFHLLSETLIDPKAITKHPAFRRNGRPAHLASVYRTMNSGILAHDGTRVRLEFVCVPGGRRSSIEAIARFCQRLTAGGGEPARRMTTAAERRRRAAIDAELDNLGIA